MLHALWLLACLCAAEVAIRGVTTAEVEGPMPPTDAPAGGCLVMPVVCVLEVRGEANEDFDDVGLAAALAEAEAYEPDAIVIDVDTTWDLYRGNDRSIYTKEDYLAAMIEVDVATAAAWLFRPPSPDDPARPKSRRIAVWVGRAVGPSAILPLACSEVYYRSNAVCGAVGGAREMLPLEVERAWATNGGSRNLRWARIRGLAVRAGYSEKLASAMCYDYDVLSCSVRAGGTLLFEDASGDTLLTDGGAQRGDGPGRKDTLEESLAFAGNDTLIVRGRQGVTLGLARACVDSVEGLTETMGLSGEAQVIPIRVRRLGPDFQDQ